ncbi:MAG: right-handed parallel beta-helix repeat-containing protein, partial [Nanoarchaeota archaeon]|nr:right-handed parallel beta-helix repeat-containing protein [Nanoarchaeota archaeon]
MNKGKNFLALILFSVIALGVLGGVVSASSNDFILTSVTPSPSDFNQTSLNNQIGLFSINSLVNTNSSETVVLVLEANQNISNLALYGYDNSSNQSPYIQLGGEDNLFKMWPSIYPFNGANLAIWGGDGINASNGLTIPSGLLGLGYNQTYGFQVVRTSGSGDVMFTIFVANVSSSNNGTNLVMLSNPINVTITPATMPMQWNVFDANSQKGFSTIQSAINAASPGDEILVAPGAYNESVIINKSITLTGNGGMPIISGNPSYNYIIKITSENFTLNNFEIFGNGSAPGDNNFKYGIWINNSNNVQIEDSVVKSIWGSGSNGIEIDYSNNSIIYNNTISSFDKRGIRYINSNGAFYNNKVIGDNVDGTSRVQDLVSLWTGSNLEIYNNSLYNALTISGVIPTWTSPAIQISSYNDGSYLDGGSSYAYIHNNDIYDSDTGIVLGSYYSSTDNSSANITNNLLHDLDVGISFEIGNFKGEQNNVSANIINNLFTGNNINVAPTYATTPINGIQSLILPLTNLSSYDSSNITVEIPEGTMINGSSSWDGTIEAPHIVSYSNISLPTPLENGGGIYTPANVVSLEVGVPGVNLTFDNAARISIPVPTFSNIAVGYSYDGAIVNMITNYCVSDNQTWANENLSAGGDCYYLDSNTSSVVIWTKHFTQFFVYNQIGPQIVSGGGGGGATGGGGGGIVSTPSTNNATNSENLTNLATNNTNQTTNASTNTP